MFSNGRRMLFSRLIIFVAFIGITGIAADIEFNNIKCITCDKEYLEFDYCYLRSENRTYKYLSMKIKLHQLPVRNSKIFFKISKRDTRRIVGPYNGSIDSCKFMRDGRNPLATHIYQAFKPYTNINHTCPYNHDLILEKVSVSHVNNVFKNFIPDGRFLLNLTFYNNNIPRGVIIVYFSKS
ncbi:uncharacterized protein LOC6578715 isoform X1 [Drosophila mojavensis]|uniref:uncharacterized protein LOC6578715 isoform X1 n=1 Tax=Drosophila mojavensis TaxID=7230 RepID=UPI0013EE853E|nr:uncharacterized protein LOC6578715 isoform X1 [Drosophila mojavensis]XP_032586041.1 uncharacterized protein LOC6578715 isoform X1 [Drosophila mojavensis]XP_032586042.1 uncharacterized protein LOC6578715 isoform X1 [Drosophila mojavensis]XP_043866724.1 uncharacterized protein LOC6578715 isoform X1 [Drosophila mojavensis]